MMFEYLIMLIVSLVPSTRATTNTFKVPLQKQQVPVVVNNKLITMKTAYFGTIYVGSGMQSFTVVFDTGSGHMFIPSSQCQDTACRKHERFDQGKSQTAVNMTYGGVVADRGDARDQVAIAYGTGEIAGEFISDDVCLGTPLRTGERSSERSNCANSWVILAEQMSSEPFDHFDFDGVIGMGLRSLALEPEFHFFGMLAKRKHMSPEFGCFLARDDAGQSELTFGGYDAGRIMTPLAYAPVVSPREGHWRVAIKSVRIGNETLPLCATGECSAIVDTGTSLLGVPSSAYGFMLTSTARYFSPATAASVDGAPADCRHEPGPPVIFDMGHFEIQLDAEDYSRREPTATRAKPNAANVMDSSIADRKTVDVCRAQLLPVDMPALGKLIFIWGEPILRKYYTSYDFERERVGFAISRHSDGGLRIRDAAAAKSVTFV